MNAIQQKGSAKKAVFVLDVKIENKVIHLSSFDSNFVSIYLFYEFRLSVVAVQLYLLI